MARPNKEGLDYFPLDCKMDDKVYMVEVELGLEGFALFVKLLMKIYNENYYIEWNERKAKIFANQNNTNINVINTLINVCLSEDLFDKKLYKKYLILTSNGIQKRYFRAVKDRKDIYIIKEYLTNGIDNYFDNLINVNINSINDDINSIKDKHNPQSIVKDSKVNNSIKEKSIVFLKAWEDFKEMRKKNNKNKPMTIRAEEMILNKLYNLSNNEKEQVGILNESTMNDWKGVFPLKGSTKEGEFEYTKYESKKISNIEKDNYKNIAKEGIKILTGKK